MKRLEYLALAIARENHSFDPGSEACSTLNPGLLRSHTKDRLDLVNESGTRVFTTFQGGWRALIDNLKAKCSGQTLANGEKGRLSPESTLRDLVHSFRYVQAGPVVEFLKDALEYKFISETTPLQYFITE